MSPVPGRPEARGGHVAPWLVEMARRAPPEVEYVVEGSTPVASFGDPLVCEVATIGINPSRREFCDAAGFLRGSKRRLATLESVGGGAAFPLTVDQDRRVVDHCRTYFHRNPYRLWFTPLDEVLTRAVGSSYYHDMACHLDLVQWATNPVWGKLPDKRAARVLLDEGSRFPLPRRCEQPAEANRS